MQKDMRRNYHTIITKELQVAQVYELLLMNVLAGLDPSGLPTDPEGVPKVNLSWHLM